MVAKWIAGVSLGAVLILGVWLGRAHAATNDRWLVKLYAGSQVVGSWEALDAGRVEGESLAFRVDAGAHDRVVRISGTYSVEPAKR